MEAFSEDLVESKFENKLLKRSERDQRSNSFKSRDSSKGS